VYLANAYDHTIGVTDPNLKELLHATNIAVGVAGILQIGKSIHTVFNNGSASMLTATNAQLKATIVELEKTASSIGTNELPKIKHAILLLTANNPAYKRFITLGKMTREQLIAQQNLRKFLLEALQTQHPSEYESLLKEATAIEEAINRFRTHTDLFKAFGTLKSGENLSFIKNFVKNNPGKYSLSEAYSIFSYTTIFYYRELNQLLRTGVNTVKTLKAKNLLNQALLKMEQVPANTTYYRGIPLEGTDLTNFIAKHKEGAIVTYDEFISCANNRADAFIDATKSNVKITIETKANSKAHTIWDLSFGKIKKGTTDEALFRTQSKFLITKNKPLGNNIYELNFKEID
jgi:hypothetical protein